MPTSVTTPSVLIVATSWLLLLYVIGRSGVAVAELLKVVVLPKKASLLPSIPLNTTFTSVLVSPDL